MRKAINAVFFAAAVLMCGVVFADAQTSRKSVSAAEVNGTFRMAFGGKFRKFSNDIKILALGDGKVRFAMDLVYPYLMGNGEASLNMGSLDGEASISRDAANYESEDGRCKFTFKFVKPGTLKVIETGTDGECGFGHNVSAQGTYTKVSSKKPTFEETN